MVKADVFILGDSPEYKDLNMEYTHRIPQTAITAHTYNIIKRMGKRDYFYIVKESVATNIDFSKPVYPHENVFQFWNGDDSVRLFNRDRTFDNPNSYTDAEWHSGNITDVYNVIDDTIEVSDLSISSGYVSGQCQTVILTRGWPKWADRIASTYYPIIHIDSDTLGLEEIQSILNQTHRKQIYIVRSDVNCRGNIQLNWIPPDYDREYFHIWNDNINLGSVSRISLINTPDRYTDVSYRQGAMPIKFMTDDQIDISANAGSGKTFTTDYNKCASFILTDGWPPWAAALCQKIWPCHHINSFSFNFEQIDYILNTISEECEYVYLFREDVYMGNWLPTYIPDEQDQKYVHTWNGTFDVSMISVKRLRELPETVIDSALQFCYAPTKDHTDLNIKQNTGFDVFFLSYDESYADENYSHLLSICPRAKRVHGVKGIFEAHKRAAYKAETSMFYVVDADARVESDFDFEWKPDYYNRDTVHVWRSRNPVNGLEYGYGGVKLFPTQRLRDVDTIGTDLTTSVSNSFRTMDTISNVTSFNSNEFEAWRSAFRECVKLSAGLTPDDSESEYRLKTWTTVAYDVPNASYAIRGAQEGMAYGTTNKHDPESLAKINDYSWLLCKYSGGE